MPKRSPSPEPVKDRPKYLSVVHPYPLRTNFEEQQEQEDFVRWLACCTGPRPLYALYHKPSAPSMVVIEIDREFDRFRSLLGAHKWAEVLSDPAEEQKDKFTRIFFCKLTTAREIEKDGWRRVDIKEVWFKGWDFQHPFRPRLDINGKMFVPNSMVYPYPPSHYCEPPTETHSNKPMCSPLPVNTFPPPPPSRPAPPPGSSEWAAAKENGSSSSQNKKKKKISAQSSPRVRTPNPAAPIVTTDSVRGGPPEIKAPSPVVPLAPAAAMTTTTTSTTSHWAKSPPPGLKSPTPSLQANAAWSHVATNKLTLDQGPLPPPPGLPPKPSAVPPQTMRWSDYLEDSDDDSVAITVGNGRQRDIMDDSESDELGRTRAMMALRSRRHEDEDEDEDEDENDYDVPYTFSSGPPAPPQVVVDNAQEATHHLSPWANYGEEEEDEEQKVEWKCKVHGVMCSKLCTERNKYEREKKRKQAEEEGRGRGWGRGRGKGRGRGRGERGPENSRGKQADVEEEDKRNDSAASASSPETSRQGTPVEEDWNAILKKAWHPNSDENGSRHDAPVEDEKDWNAPLRKAWPSKTDDGSPEDNAEAASATGSSIIVQYPYSGPSYGGVPALWPPVTTSHEAEDDVLSEAGWENASEGPW